MNRTVPWHKNQGTYRTVTFVYRYTPTQNLHLQYTQSLNNTFKICIKKYKYNSLNKKI
jgi:hypothetical protein